MKCAYKSRGPHIWYGWKTVDYKYFGCTGFINLALRDITYSPALPNTVAFDSPLTTDWKKKQHQGSGTGAMIMQNSLNSYQQLSVVAQLTFPWALSVRSTAPAVLWSILTWLPWEQVQTTCVESWNELLSTDLAFRQYYWAEHQTSITPPLSGQAR